jgi:hypothetical protein
MAKTNITPATSSSSAAQDFHPWGRWNRIFNAIAAPKISGQF